MSLEIWHPTLVQLLSKRLEGKKIIVTEAGQGIGKATAIAFHREGERVTETEIN